MHGNPFWKPCTFQQVVLVNSFCKRQIYPEIKNQLNVKFQMAIYFYRQPKKLREGNAFTPVCHSVHGRGVRYQFLSHVPFEGLPTRGEGSAY